MRRGSRWGNTQQKPTSWSSATRSSTTKQIGHRGGGGWVRVGENYAQVCIFFFLGGDSMQFAVAGAGPGANRQRDDRGNCKGRGQFRVTERAHRSPAARKKSGLGRSR